MEKMTKDEFYERVAEIKKELLAIAGAILRNEMDAEDAVSNAILRGCENLEQLRDVEKFRSWMLTITRNEALKMKRKRFALPGDEMVEAMLSPVQDQYDELWDIIQGMKEEYRQVVTLFYYGELSLKDVAKNLDIPVGTVKSRLNRGKKMIKKELEKAHQTKKKPIGMKILIVVLCLAIGAGIIASAANSDVCADFFGGFKKTIFDALGIDKEKGEQPGVEVHDTEEEVSRKDLMMELVSKVIDKHNIYLMIKITAPPEIAFTDDIKFDYIAFSKGTNYNADALLSGATDDQLFEVSDGKTNIATYIMHISCDEELEPDSTANVFLKDLMMDPYGEKREMLVEGIWNINFTIEQTVTDNIELRDTGTEYPFHDIMARMKSLEISPLGMTLKTDITGMNQDELGILDNSIMVRLQMIDGSQLLVRSHNLEDETIVSGGSSLFEEEDGALIMTDTYGFADTIKINEILGVYIEDVYVPIVE